ncbi:MYPU_1760 family metalloprotease [Metamycoplasma canadense]|nr:hypothetical protein [Metamycoplasma canadense]
MVKKRKFRLGTFLYSFFISFFSVAILGILLFFTIKNSSSFFNRNEIEVKIDYGANDIKTDIIIKRNNIDNSLIFNPKNEKNSNVLDPSFKTGNLTFIENPIGFSKDKKPIYFLGVKGLIFLNEMFKQRAIYGPEINSLYSVNISDDNSTVNAKGLYFPTKKVISIFTKEILENNVNLLEDYIEKRAEIIFGTLLHEYGHHIDNMYNKAVKKTDPFANLDLIEYNGDHDYYETEINNNKFLTEFRKNLNYYDDPDRNKFLRNHQDFYYDKDKIPVYKDFSANDLFRISNINISSEEKKKFLILDSGKYYFNNFKYQPIQFNEPTSLKSIKYLFSFTELFPREIIKLSLGPNQWFYNPRNLFKNFFFFIKNNSYKSPLIFNAAGDDILKNITVINGEPTTFASNWVFKDQIEEFVSNKTEYLIQNNIKIKRYVMPFKNVGNTLHKNLFKAYIDLIGWGQLISFANYNINNNQKNYLNFGGYFQIPKNENFKNLNKKIILVEKNNEKNKIELNFDFQNYNLIAKKKWNSVYHFLINNKKQPNYFDESWVYPNLFDKNFQYVSYFVKNINKNEIKSKLHNKQFDVRLWIDLNNNNKIDNEKDNKEIFSLLNDNHWNNSGKQFYEKYLNDKRNTTTYRKYNSNRFEKNEWFKLNKDKKENKYYYSLEDY